MPAGEPGQCTRLCKRAPRLGVDSCSQNAAETVSHFKEPWELGQRGSQELPSPQNRHLPSPPDPTRPGHSSGKPLG